MIPGRRYHVKNPLYSWLLWNTLMIHYFSLEKVSTASHCLEPGWNSFVWFLYFLDLEIGYLLKILYRYSRHHFFHSLTVNFHVWVFLWTALFAHWHRDMQNWSHGISYLFLAATLLLISQVCPSTKNSIFLHPIKSI